MRWPIGSGLDQNCGQMRRWPRSASCRGIAGDPENKKSRHPRGRRLRLVTATMSTAARMTKDRRQGSLMAECPSESSETHAPANSHQSESRGSSRASRRDRSAGPRSETPPDLRRAGYPPQALRSRSLRAPSHRAFTVTVHSILCSVCGLDVTGNAMKSPGAIFAD